MQEYAPTDACTGIYTPEHGRCVYYVCDMWNTTTMFGDENEPLLLSVGAERSTSIRKASSTTQGHLDLGKPVNGFTRFVSENDHFF